jgi:hypothetical protein
LRISSRSKSISASTLLACWLQASSILLLSVEFLLRGYCSCFSHGLVHQSWWLIRKETWSSMLFAFDWLERVWRRSRRRIWYHF